MGQVRKKPTKPEKHYYVADFETTTRAEDCRVWAYAVCEVKNIDNVVIGTSIDDFMSWCSSQKHNVIVYFHNLKFDGAFILSWLFKNGYEWVSKNERRTHSFTTLISDKGMWYQIEVVFYLKGHRVKKVTFMDSLKLIPLSVRAIAKSFKMEQQKGSIDYSAHDILPPGSPLTAEEEDYIKRDVQIVAHAIAYFHSQGLNKMTIGACALDEYKKLISKRAFDRWFPTPKYHNDVKQSYKGGFTYLNPKFAGKVIYNGVVLDVNSLYPSVMRFEQLPYATPIFFIGKYKADNIYPLYVQMLKCSFEIKPGKIPTIQIKHSEFFKGNEYLTSSDDREVTLCLTSVDLEMFFEHYDVYNVEYISGWKFKSTQGLYDAYIDKWSETKIASKKEGNHGMYLISKLFLNSLYGKFGSGTEVISKIPIFDEETQIVKYKFSDAEEKDGVYIAVASFITSYARRKTIKAAQTVMDNYNTGKSNIQFVYADTDSLHCYSPDQELPEGLDIDSTKLGAWDYESKFTKAKFLRQKCYIEYGTSDVENDNPEYSLKVTVSGMPEAVHEQVTFANFKIGAKYTGKLAPKTVNGGIVLEDIDFTIKK